MIFKLKRLKLNIRIESLLEFASKSNEGIIIPAQIYSEIFSLLKLLEERRPKYILEIGTAKGGTLFLFSRVISADAIIISVDLPGGPYLGGYPKWKFPMYKNFALKSQCIHLIRGDSHDQNSLKKVRAILKENKLDFLYIDGDHTYKGVRMDFQMYSPLVKEGGIIAFHDIVKVSPEKFVEVNKFWKEIKNKYKYKEIVDNWEQGECGIGYIYYLK